VSDVVLNDKGLKQLIRAFKGQVPSARVGILGSKTRKIGGGEELSNAEIGAAHEYGSPARGLPVRSFLRMPLGMYLGTYLEQSHAFDREAIKKVIDEGSIRQYVARIGIVAEEVVQDAFDTGGFGHWKPSKMEFKSVKQTLVETQQLRNSITSEVIERA
jgi:hypothetical protein